MIKWLCAMPIRRRPLLPDVCAMIPRSAGRRASLPLLLRLPVRSTPMIGADRSSVPCRTILFFLVLLGTPTMVRSATLEDSARELARKIAAAMLARDDVSIDMGNLSSSPSDEFAAAERALRDELEKSKVHVVASGAAAVHVKITLSENLKGLLLTAEIPHGDSPQALFISVDRYSDFLLDSRSIPVVLQSKIIWQGQEQILDADVASWAGGSPRLLLLHPDGLEVQVNSINVTVTVKFLPAGNPARDPQGILDLNGAIAAVKFPTQDCTVNLELLQLLDCHAVTATDARNEEFVSGGWTNPILSGRVGEKLPPENGCGAGLTTGSADDTQADWVQALSTKPSELAISNKVEYPGPVLAMRGRSGPSRAIVRNLKTGNYEAYSLTCGK